MPPRLTACFLLAVVFNVELDATEPVREKTTAASKIREPLPNEDDANLHDVQFVSRRAGWAVGDRGVIWHSDDGGQNWTLQPSGVGCPLHSICFLSDRVGWVAGGGTVPYTRQSYGVILKTTDGGNVWQPVVSPPAAVAKSTSPGKPVGMADSGKSATQPPALPRIRSVKFFSPDEGIVIGEGTGANPSGVYSTNDAGKSWHPLPGKVSPGWYAADFLNPAAGVIVGARGSVARAVEGKIVAPRVESLGPWGLYDIALGPERTGWLVGDGGLVLQTVSAGLVWQIPATPLPEGIRGAFDFRAVCCRGDNVWLAGNPGSTIWHSSDGGQTWQRQKTGQPVPLARLHFSSDELGWAVGALGMILQTKDGGQTWRAARGSGRRLAMLALFGQSQDLSLGLFAELSGEEGYRSLASVVAREDDTSGAGTEADFSARLNEAVLAAGGSASQVGWQLPLAIPGLERNFDRLVADWNRRTEFKLEEILTGALVRQIRTWRPSVFVVEQPETGNALVKLVGKAAIKAVEQAADSTRFIEQQELAGLEAWEVKKVFVRLPRGSSGHVNVEPYRYLPRSRAMTGMVATTAEALFRDSRDASLKREAYRLIRSQWDEGQGASLAGGLFAGISIPAGSDARRALAVFDESDLKARLKIAERQRNFAAYTERFLGDSRHAGQLIAQLTETVRGMNDAEAAWQLSRLAERYEASGQWELGELTLIELVEKYPEQPTALAAMQRLMQFWGSAEITWRRLKKSGTEQRRDQNHPEVAAQAAIQMAEALLRKQARSADRTIFDNEVGDDTDEGPDESSRVPKEPSTVSSESRILRADVEQKFRFWRTRAMKMAGELERRDGLLAAEPSVQFPLAAIHRQRTSFLKSDEIYRRFMAQDTSTRWSQAADAEIWLLNPIRPPTGPAAACGVAFVRPVLDGLLSDPCWRAATELPLSAEPLNKKSETRQALAMLCYDSEFLYFAASLPRARGVRTDGPVEGSRRYDEDQSDFDRVSLSLDVDRDYVTFFNFTIDQRGCTADACWNDPSWNPRWFVAVAADETHWRIEAAIPFDELTPEPAHKGTAWAMGITRTIPAVGLESWTHPAAAAPRAENFGILRFDGPRDPR